VVVASLTIAVGATFALVVAGRSSSADDEPKAVVTSPRVLSREYGPAHVRTWEPPGATVLDRRRVSTNAWRRIGPGGTEVGLYVEAEGTVEGARLSMDPAVAEDLVEFLERAHDRAPATLAPVVNEAVALWRHDPDSSFACRLDLRTGEVEILGSRGSIRVDPVEVAAAIREALADATALRRAPDPLPRLAR
jgi:hypothetical protein